MKKLLSLFTALILFAGVGFSQDLMVRSIDITTQAKFKGKDITNTINTATQTITYSNDSITFDFKGSKFQSITLTDSLVLFAKNLRPGGEINLRIIGAAGTESLTFPAAWKFVGTKPTTIAATKTAILVIRSYGSNDANVVCSYQVEP